MKKKTSLLYVFFGISVLENHKISSYYIRFKLLITESKPYEYSIGYEF